MKILAIICEFNPFHNGHRYLIEKAKAISGCDAVLCIMSGNFTQRGEICITDKFTRAEHAVLGGADCVIQLPSAFAVAPAEIFASGAVKILSAIPDVGFLAFGSENAEIDYLYNAEIALNEDKNFKTELADMLNKGESYIKSYMQAFTACGGDEKIVSNPNNILGFEYTKAVLKQRANIKIFPIQRVGGGFNDKTLDEQYSSAYAIRNNLNNENVKYSVPDFVYRDLPANFDTDNYDNLLRFALFKSSCRDLKNIYGCGEGLENKLKSLINSEVSDIIDACTSKRYSSSRIKRILCANLLELYQSETENFLKDDLYIKPLAVKKERKDELLASLSRSPFPVVTGINTEMLTSTAKSCFDKDRNELSVYNLLTNSEKKDYMILV